MRLLAVLTLAGFASLVPPGGAAAQAGLDLETGIVFCSYNDVRIPGDTGTEFSLVDDLSADHEPFFRARIDYTLKRRHFFSLLIAQLSLPAAGNAPEDLSFNGVVFPEGQILKGEYRFDSYRLTYRYLIARRERFEAGVGLTAKIRDAEVRIESESVVTTKKNTGFVPLVNFSARWRFADSFWLLLEGDALAAPQGRAEDVLLAVQFWPSERFGFKAGYRIVEGGADNDEVYNFALINYVVLGFYANF